MADLPAEDIGIVEVEEGEHAEGEHSEDARPPPPSLLAAPDPEAPLLMWPANDEDAAASQAALEAEAEAEAELEAATASIQEGDALAPELVAPPLDTTPVVADDAIAEIEEVAAAAPAAGRPEVQIADAEAQMADAEARRQRATAPATIAAEKSGGLKRGRASPLAADEPLPWWKTYTGTRRMSAAAEGGRSGARA